MPTDISVRISRNPYQGYEARFWWNGMLNRYSFDSQDELAYQLVRDKIHPEVRDEVISDLEHYEWNHTYPLGVVYVGEAVCDMAIDDPVYANVRPAEAPSQFWELAAASLRLGAIAAPWVLLVLAARWVGGW